LDLSIIVVSWNTRDRLEACLRSVYDNPPPGDFEVWVVDNASGDGSPALVREQFPNAHLLENDVNRGFAFASNQGLASSSGRYVLLLNSDAEVEPGGLATMIRFMEGHPAAGALGPMLVNPDGSFQASYARFPSLAQELLLVTGAAKFVMGPYAPSPRPQPTEAPHPVDWVAGAALLVRREVADHIGPLDTGYFLFSEETDWCWRMGRAGWPVWYVPDIRVVHHAGASSRQQSARNYGVLYRSKLRFFSQHYGRLATWALQLAFIAIGVLRWALWQVRARLSSSIEAKARYRLRAEHERSLLSACLSPQDATVSPHSPGCQPPG
jgi:N-acetylglucosaminyl-diphospho-decaprenol L-rhamnosyltransferase